LVAPNSDLKTSGGTVVSHEVVGKLSWDDFFDLLDRSDSFGSVTSSSAVVDSHRVLWSLAVFDDLGSCLLHK
jgi:hypothetical protein